MATAVAHSAQTGSTVSNTLTITSATLGNILVCFLQQSASTVAPTFSDTTSGSTGWVANATKAVFNASTDSLWVGYKTAVGGETGLNPTAGTGGTINGLCYFELSGAANPAVVDVIVNSDNIATNTTATSGSVTTTDLDAILAAVAMRGGGSGLIGAWTGTGPMTNIGTASSRCFGGSYVPGATVSGATFTANWTTTHLSGMLVAAFKPAATTIPTGWQEPINQPSAHYFKTKIEEA